jgi:hypothetical protein
MRSVTNPAHSDPTEIIPGQEPQIAPGVRGCMIDDGGALWVPLIFADRPGTGDVGRFLDSLPRHRTVKFPTVLSRRLEGMLQRRGFRPTVEDTPELGPVEVWTR